MKTITMLRSMGAAALALAALGTMSVAPAQDFSTRRTWVRGAHEQADGSLVDVQIRVDGRDTPLYFRPGQDDRHYFQAFKGRNYTLVLQNHSSRRVGVLIAVDGLNVVNGERSRLHNDEAMYVLDPYEQTEIQGWRTSLDDVRRFVFVDEDRSYAERTGQANGDMGWIRVLAFREVEPVKWLPVPRVRNRGFEGDESAPRSDMPREESKSNELAPRAQAMAPESSNPGTGWGSHEHDRVERTQFRAERNAVDQIVLRYEYESGLRALGIFPRRSRTYERDHGSLGFAQSPRW
jgi:hypothetical protein